MPAPGEEYARRIVKLRAFGRCEMCGVAATDWSHRRAAGQGGGWRAANGLYLCRECHSWLEGNPLLADAGGWRLVHRDTDPALVPVWLFGGCYARGWHLLDDDGGVAWVDWVDNDLPEQPTLPYPAQAAMLPGRNL